MPIHRVTLCLMLLAGCEPAAVDPDGGSSARGPACSADPGALTLRCIRWEDPNVETVDDESSFELVVRFGAGAFDGTARAIAGESDYVVTGPSGSGLMIDESRIAGLAPGPSNDALVSDVRLWLRVHNPFGGDLYRRVGVTGTASVDAGGHGRVELAWTGSPTSYARAGSLVDDF